jgi:hypothetical protein
VLYHVGFLSRAGSVTREGLLPDYATGKLRAVFLVCRKRLKWACRHVRRRHHNTTDRIAIWAVRVPVRRMVRIRHGLYSINRPIPPENLTLLPLEMTLCLGDRVTGTTSNPPMASAGRGLSLRLG